MRYFSLLDFQHWVLAVGLGLVAVIAVYLAWYGYYWRKLDKLEDPYDNSRVGVPGSKENRAAPILIFVYIGSVLWMLGYFIVVGLFGGQII